MRSLLLATLLASLYLALVVAPAAAQDKRAARAACKSDYMRFCASVALGQGRVLQCLQSHINEIAPPCRVVIEERLTRNK
jgi:Cysteine rich repeat